MAGGVRERAVLPPAGHPGIDQPRVPLGTDVRTEPEPFRNTRPEPLDQDIGAGGEPEQDVHPGGVLQVEPDGPAAAAQRVGRGKGLPPGPAGPVNPQHVRAQVGQDHAAKRRGRQTRELDHSHAVQWSHSLPPWPARSFCALPGKVLTSARPAGPRWIKRLIGVPQPGARYRPVGSLPVSGSAKLAKARRLARLSPRLTRQAHSRRIEDANPMASAGLKLSSE